LRLAEQLSVASPLAERLAAANADHSAYSLAQRFAPDTIRPRANADPTVLPSVPPAPRGSNRGSGIIALSIAAGLVSATALVAGMIWLGGISDLNLDQVFQDSGIASPAGQAPHASAALAINVDPPRSGTPDLGPSDEEAPTTGRPDAAPPSSSGFAVRAGETGRIEGLMAHGQKMIGVGYFAGARAYYRRAAEAGSGEAAVAVGATYDPEIIARMGVQGIKPDRAEAAKWYARAAGLGINDREPALRMLTESWVKDAEAPGQAGIMAEAKPATEDVDSTNESPDATPPDQPVRSQPKTQRVASGRASAVSSVRPQLLASEQDAKPGPLSMFVRAAAGLSAQEKWLEVASPVNIRNGPSSDSGSNRVLLKGTKLRVVGREGNWIRVQDPKTQQEGYIYARFLKETKAP
jgi:hypothetical protein